jgi:curved DNA-binding protein CbpA
MGVAHSQIDPTHFGMYKKLLVIQDPAKKLQVIETVFGDPSVVQSAKFAGVYSHILQVAAAIRHGKPVPALPGEQSQKQFQQQQYQQSQQQQQQQQFPAQLPAKMPAQLQYHPQAFQQRASQPTNQLISQIPAKQDYFQQVSKPKRSEKALNFFSACLRVLNIQEEVALTEDMLKSAYKKAVIRAHPDKPGGSKEAFDAVTRAYAYLVDILKLVKGAHTSVSAGGGGVVPGLDTVQEQRRSAANDWKMPEEPVKLNPKNLNMTVFNQLFEQTRIPDPDEDGYGDWLKDEAGSGSGKNSKKGGKKFSEDFNREVFNRMFEEEQQHSTQTGIIQFQHPQELILAPNSGVELGRDRPQEYTAAPGSDLQFTDLRAAYTQHNTVSNQIKGVRVENRDFNSYKAQRERAPDAYNQSEMAALQAYEAQQKAREEQRRIRAAQEQIGARDYFERMKQLVITEK